MYLGMSVTLSVTPGIITNSFSADFTADGQPLSCGQYQPQDKPEACTEAAAKAAFLSSVMSAVSAAVAFVTAPTLGALSDTYGRRPLLVFTAVVATLEGSRPLLAEIQALVGAPGSHTPARTVVGVDRSRVLMLAAVLQKHGIGLQDRDVFVNAAGGVRVAEPAADLAIVAALASTWADRPLPSDTVVLGEVGLVGEIRAVSHPAQRMREAARQGFRRALVPPSCVEYAPAGLHAVGVKRVSDALDALGDG